MSLPSLPRKFTMPSDRPGPKCQNCGQALTKVYRTRHEDRFTFREHICEHCGRKNVTMQQTVLTVD